MDGFKRQLTRTRQVGEYDLFLALRKVEDLVIKMGIGILRRPNAKRDGSSTNVSGRMLGDNTTRTEFALWRGSPPAPA
jgi:hypothetical protein